MGQQQGEGGDAQDGDPDHPLATDAVTDRPAEHGASRDGKQERKQMELGAIQRQAELVHQIEGVIAAQAGHVEELGEHQQTEDGQRPADLAAAQATASMGLHPLVEVGPVMAGPAPDQAEHHDTHQGEQREPGGAALSLRHYDERGEQRAYGRAEVAADLEQGLGQTWLVASRHAGDPGGFRVEDGRTHADQHGRQQHGAKAARL